MNKYLIFRTDRIGDFFLSAILVKSIKENDPFAYVTLVASQKNYNYIKDFKLVDDVILLKNTIFDKIRLIFKLRNEKFHSIIIHDHKKRSHLISFFLKRKNKISLNNTLNFSHIDNIKNILNKLNYTFYETALNIFENKNLKKFEHEDFVLFHFDEKWIHKDYIEKFINIEPSINELTYFFNGIIAKTKKKLIITTGLVAPRIFDQMLNKNKNKNIHFYKNLDFLKLESIVSKSNILISCHGSVSHIAAALKIKQIDIIDKSYEYEQWTDHFRNYNYLYRAKFDLLSKKIIEKL